MEWFRIFKADENSQATVMLKMFWFVCFPLGGLCSRHHWHGNDRKKIQRASLGTFIPRDLESQTISRGLI